MARARVDRRENWLIFVDTNILLDFYRISSGSATRQLNALEKHKKILITSDQIRMEFLKNRQKVVIESLKGITKPNKVSLPTVVQDFQPASMLAKHIDNAIQSHSKIRGKFESILRDPSRYDPVFQSLKRIFNFESDFNLKRPNKTRFMIRTLARKRFILGYPPRKAGDVSIGDAINWEWIIWCAQNSNKNHHILIVSRDGDYGVAYEDKVILNDWLRREFKDRISQKRKIELTNRLTVAMKILEERVNPEDEIEETKLISEPDPRSLL